MTYPNAYQVFPGCTKLGRIGGTEILDMLRIESVYDIKEKKRNEIVDALKDVSFDNFDREIIVDIAVLTEETNPDVLLCLFTSLYHLVIKKWNKFYL
jgi:hypothetical protein